MVCSLPWSSHPPEAWDGRQPPSTSVWQTWFRRNNNTRTQPWWGGYVADCRLHHYVRPSCASMAAGRPSIALSMGWPWTSLSLHPRGGCPLELPTHFTSLFFLHYYFFYLLFTLSLCLLPMSAPGGLHITNFDHYPCTKHFRYCDVSCNRSIVRTDPDPPP